MTTHSLFNFVSSFLIILSVVILVRQCRKSKTRKQKHARLPPGPWRLPIFGSLHHLIGGLPHRTLRSLAQRYGPIMYLQVGEIPTVVISSPSIAKQVLKTHDIAFANRPELTSTSIVFYNCKEIVFSQYGEYWRQMRKICTIELLSAKMVKSFGAIRKDELSSLISSVHSTSGCAVNITEKMFWFSNSVTCRSVFGNICKDRDRFIRMLKKTLSLVGGFDVADVFPSWKFLHKISGVERNLVSAHNMVDEFMEDIVNEHIKNKIGLNKRENGELGDEDLVDVLLRIKETAQLQFPITNEHIKGVIFDLFVAGTETSSTTVIWGLTELMKNPNIMRKAQNEVRKVLKGKKDYEEEDVEKLEYLKLVIKETLRLHPPGPLLPRECREETNIGGYMIPHKTRVLVNAWALGRDPNSWDDPESFIPERFRNSSIDFMGKHFEYLPFGAGRRGCPGILFGLTNVALPLAQLLYHFQWQLPHGTTPKDVDMSETHGISAAKLKHLFLVPTSFDNCAN